MASDDISTTIVSLTKRPISRKHRIHSHNQSFRKNLIENSRINRSSSKLPSLLTKNRIYSSTSGSMQCKRTSSSSKLERPSSPTNNRPTLYTLTSDYDQKRKSEVRRRQIYALNHFMRELEQKQFRQFCTSRSTDIIDDTNKKSSI